AAAPASQTGELAQTGGGGASVGLLAGGAGGVLALGAGSLIYARRRAHR
ncbi:MAG: LPXTG cell wall anchor domain-containing protein, partial [Streptomycetaceae bacterium]|nr:LPXTG cell wall anchor domain-containing protein [Streptomycetaceae bacterium]